MNKALNKFNMNKFILKEIEICKVPPGRTSWLIRKLKTSTIH